MKVNISIEATAQEMREFFGLPNIEPLQREILQIVRDNMHKGVVGFDALSLMKPLFPAQVQSMELMQKAFWDALAGAGSAAREGATKTNETAENTATAGINDGKQNSDRGR